MRGRSPRVGLILGALLLAQSLPSASDAEDTGKIVGTVLDAENRPVDRAIVVLIDPDSGIPYARGNRQTLIEAIQAHSASADFAYATTDERGYFAFDPVPVGKYRLVAQSWRGVESVKGIMAVNGEVIQLHGTVDRIEVAAGGSPEVVIRPLGTGVLRLDQKIGNDETFLLVSTSPPSADPILGFAGWWGPMLRNVVGANRMPRGKTTIHGLLEGRVHVVLFAADDSPGFGAGQADVKPGTLTDLYVPLVAGWSDGQHDPPERLAPLVDEVRSLTLDKQFSVDAFRKHSSNQFAGRGVSGKVT